MQGRFAGHVFPRETLEVQMWRTASSTVTFQVLVKERGKVALSNAAVVSIVSIVSNLAMVNSDLQCQDFD